LSVEENNVTLLQPSPDRSVVMPPVVILDRALLRAAGMRPEELADQYLTEQYRRIKRPLLEKINQLREARTPGAQLCMVASALPGDGKTFTAVNLAISIARERDVSVLLIDADVAKCHITRTLGLEALPGLLNALVDTSLDVESLIRPTDISGLSILPSGPPHPAASELLSSARMASLAYRLTERDPTRILLFDTAPLLLSSEARAIVKLARQIALVVHAGVTPQAAVNEALGHLPADKLAGLILNHSQSQALDHSYGYGYGYDYYNAQNAASAVANKAALHKANQKSGIKLARPQDLPRKPG
jgi:protein-tyrosine kinase